VRENITALFLLYVRPVTAISRILDHGRLWFAIVAALAVSLTVHLPGFTAERAADKVIEQTRKRMESGQVKKTPAETAPTQQKEAGEEPEEASPFPGAGVLTMAALRWTGFYLMSFVTPLIALALAFIPVVILVRAVSGYGSFPVLMRSEYLSLLLCGLMTWTAAYLPLAVATPIMGQWGLLSYVSVFIVANLYFVVLAALSIRTLLGTGFGQALGLAAIASMAAVIGIALSDFTGGMRYYMMSPFLLYYGYSMFGSDVRSLGDGLRSRQHLQQQLQIATTNPRDADAHYQLGLIYQKRRQYSEAVARFQKAIEIDPSEADAQFQLGRIAREQGRFDDAIRYLNTAAALNEKLASGEVWRELGAAYFSASRFEESAAALKKYTDRRPYDPEGLYWFGKSLAGLQKFTEAREAFTTCVEAVDTMPKHRRAEVRKWKGLAKTELKATKA
jgi:Tfp pilus assembly protein PilF